MTFAARIATASPCSYPRCGNTTKSATRRCFYHRGLVLPAVERRGSPKPLAPAAPAPAQTVTTPLHRVVHHDDDSTYDELFEDHFGRLHREDGPASITYDAFTGLPKAEEWWVDGRQHRVGGPATTIFYDGTQKVSTESYFLDGKGSRLDGPAYVTYDENGKVSSEGWRFRGSRYPGQVGIAKMLATLSDNEIAFELRRTIYAAVISEGMKPRRVCELLAEGLSTLESIRAVHGGAPVEWARAFEESPRADR